MTNDAFISKLQDNAPIEYRIGTYGDTQVNWGNWKNGNLYVSRSNGKVIIIAIRDEDPEFRPSEFDGECFAGEKHLLQLKGT
jgi:hypothetical protein